ncbi:hypothetical protein D3C78_1335190 [compost metagenome]
MAVLQGHQVQVGALAVETGDELIAFQPFIDMEQTQGLGFLGNVQAQVVNQLQRRCRQMHVSPRTLHQRQVGATHRPRRAGQWRQAKWQGFAVMQGGRVGCRQPGVIEPATEPALRGFQQAFFGNLLDRRVQGKVQFVGRHVTGDQLEHHVATVLPTLTHQHPVVAILPMQGQAHRDPEIGQFQGKSFAVADRDRPTTLQGLGEIQRPADALVAQAFRSRFDE